MHEMQTNTLELLLSDLALFETTADPGPGRGVEQVSVHLYPDGSGELIVQTAATADEPGMEQMLNRVFFNESKLTFESIDGLYAILRNIDALKPKHPEAA